MRAAMCVPTATEAKQNKEGAGARAGDRIGCSARGGSGSGSHRQPATAPAAAAATATVTALATATKAEQNKKGAGARAGDRIGCGARGGSGSGSHCAGAMKRRRSTPVSRPLPARAVAAVRKGLPHSLAARLARVCRQRVTSATVPRVAAGEPLSRDYLQLTTTCRVVRTPFTFFYK